MKKRRTRKKQQPLPPAAKAEKRRIFLEKNRIAAGKCREKNRLRWDRLQEQCLTLEAQNKGLKELRRELKTGVEGLAKYVRAHGECGVRGIEQWIESHQPDELGVESEMWDSPLQDPQSSERGSADSALGDSGIGESLGQERSRLELQASFPEPQEPSHALSLSATPETVNPTPEMGPCIDMPTFLADDEEVPDLSPSRRSFASTLSSDRDLLPTSSPNTHSPSPLHAYGEAFPSAPEVRCENADPGRKVLEMGAEVEIVGMYEDLPDCSDSGFPLCDFTAQVGARVGVGVGVASGGGGGAVL